MQLLRDNKDTLMSVLDAFVHDPLVEWEDEKRRIVSCMFLASDDSILIMICHRIVRLSASLLILSDPLSTSVCWPKMP